MTPPGLPWVARPAGVRVLAALLLLLPLWALALWALARP